MELVKITDVTNQFDVTSRTLRYYEQVGILQSVRLPLEKYRFYDETNLNRLQQIIVLRKMQIPIKDIVTIYESQDMTILVQSFVNRMNEIDNEIEALAELKALTNDFLEVMIENGISHISALPLLYERVEHQILPQNKERKHTRPRLNEITEKLAKPLSLNIIELPTMLMLSSLKPNGQSDIDGYWNALASHQIPFGTPGSHSLFEFQTENDTIIIQKVSDTFVNPTDFQVIQFEGGLFATCSAYVDEDIGEIHQRMIKSFDTNFYIEVDYRHNGSLRHESLIETIISDDYHRERIIIYLPVKKRPLKASYFDTPRLINDITPQEIIHANPILNRYPVTLDKITPIYSPHYRLLDNGEAEFVAFITPRMLSTNVGVTIPFRVDIEFLADSASEAYGYYASEGSLWFSHNHCSYTINGGNHSDLKKAKHDLRFDQPILGNTVLYPGLGKIEHDVYNKLTWIVGENHFAVIINDEVRYCSDNLPYMKMDMHLQQPSNIFIGSNGQGKKHFRSITISQLKIRPKIRLKKGELHMSVKQSNNILPNLHPIVTPHYGENYWFNGCAKFLMECLLEPDYDYWFFAGLTGENFTQVYSRNHFRGDGVVDYRLGEKGNHEYIEDIFALCGYSSSYIPLRQILSNPEMYIQTLIAYIDKGIPVILNNYGNNPHNRFGWGVIVGYEDYGKTLLYMGGDATEPDRISVKDLLPDNFSPDGEYCNGWLFIGEKKKDIPLAEIYRKRILTLPELMTYENNNYLFGAKAFRTWADDIERGIFDGMTSDDYDDWGMYKVYIVNLATNSGGCRSFLEKAYALNNDLTFIENVIEEYAKTGTYWNQQNGDDLEAIGGGFNVTLENLQDKEKRNKIALKIREFADCMDKVVAFIKEFNQTNAN